MSKSPAAILYNADGTAVVTVNDGAALTGSSQALPIAGKDDSSNAQFVRTAADGTVRVDPTGTTAQPVTGPLTDSQLRATPVPVSDGGGSLTVDGTVTANAGTGPWPVTDNGGSLTVDGVVGISGTVPVSGPLTNTELRASPVPVSGTVTANVGTGPWPVTDNGGSLTVDGPLTDSQLRATAVPISAAALPLPAGAATEATLATRLTEATFAARVNTLGQKAMSASTPVVLPSDQSAIPITTTGGEEATYTVIALATTPGNNKSMLSIYNPTGSGYVLKLREFYLRNAATTAVTGVAAALQLHRFVSAGAPTGGTTLTVVAHDSEDALPASMDARTGGTISGEIATPLDIIRMSTDEWGPGTADVESAQQSIANYLPARAKRDGLLKPFYARPGQGLHIKFATNSSVGALDVILVFTKN